MEEYYNDARYVDNGGKVYDFTGWYKISNKGTVKSLITGKESQITENQKQKYIIIDLRKDGNRRKSFYYHRLIVSSFPEIFGELNGNLDVNHKDENTHNNSFENLEIVNRKTNCNWGTRNERISNSQKNNIRSKKVVQYSLNNEYIKEWSSTREIERQLGFAHNNISDCCNGRYSQIYGYIWRYKQ